MRSFSMKVFDILNVKGHTILAGNNRRLDGLSVAEISKLIGNSVRVGLPEGTKILKVESINVRESLTGQKNIFISVHDTLPKMRNVELQVSSS